MDQILRTDYNGTHVLVVGINYTPEHTGIAPYTTQACEYLAECGATVKVLTGIPHYPSWTVPAEFRRTLSSNEICNGVPVHRLRHFVPSSQTALKRGAYEASFALNLSLHMRNAPAAVVLAVVPSLLSAAYSSYLAQRQNARFVLWIQDLMAPGAIQSGITGGRRVAKVTKLVERWTLRRADRVIVLNEAFQRYVVSLGINPTAVAIQPNWTHVKDVPSNRDYNRAELGWKDGEIVALHSGNMGLKQGLENIVEAARLAALLGDVRVRFVLMGDGSQRHCLQTLGAAVSNLEFLPPANSEDYMKILKAADVLLVNERSTSIDMSLPSKLTSYFRAGRPIVAAAHSAGGTASEVRRSGAGQIVPPDAAEALLDAIVKIGANIHEASQMGVAARRYADNNLSKESALFSLGHLITGREA